MVEKLDGFAFVLGEFWAFGDRIDQAGEIQTLSTGR
jgi:hypothetical protein